MASDICANRDCICSNKLCTKTVRSWASVGPPAGALEVTFLDASEEL